MSINLTLSQVPGPDGVLIAVVALKDSAGLAEVTGVTQTGATWQLAAQGGDGFNRMEIWFASDAEGADTAVAIGTVADQSEAAVVAEFSNVFEREGTVLDRTAINGGTAAVADSGTTTNTTLDKELWVAGLEISGGSLVSFPTDDFAINAQESTGLAVNEVTAAFLSKVVTAIGAAHTQAVIDGGSTDFGGAIATFFASPPVVITITAVTPEQVSEDGGYLLQISGDFEDALGVPHEVFVGPNGDETDALCLSGIPGRPTTIYPYSEQELRCYTPRLSSGVVSVYIRREDLSQDGVLENAIQVFPRGFETVVHALRRIMHPKWYAGPRDIEQEEPV